MIINSITLRDFRNYELFQTDFVPGTNVITGDNANGKTNLLEAVYMLACGRSFRTRSDRELIRFGCAAADVTAEFFSADREQKLDIRFAAGRRKQLILNGVKLKTVSELSGKFAAVLFCPEDLDLIRAGAAERRRFMDSCILQLRPRYAAALSELGRALDGKNRILKDWRDKPSILEMLDEYNEQIISLGAVLIRYRAQFCRSVNETAAAIVTDFSGGRDALSLTYSTVRTVTDPFADAETIAAQLREHQRQHREAELASGQILTGAGRDDVLIDINGRAAKSFASQGQTRTAALGMKLAEWELMAKQLGEYPVLLLDDVLSELDSSRQNFVLNRISGGQVFITCCEDDGISGRTGGRVIAIENGALKC